MEKGGSMESGPEAADTLGRGDIRKVLQIMDELRDSEIVRTTEGAEAWDALQAAMQEGRPDARKVNAALEILRPRSSDSPDRQHQSE